MMDGVSVVIPSYNSRSLLEKFLPALMREVSLSRDEVIVVDDASTDGTGEFLVRQYPAIRLITLEKNSGYHAASNRGVEASRHRLVCLMNSDVEVCPGFLEPLVRDFEQPGTFVVCSLGLPAGGGARAYALPTVSFKFGIYWYAYSPIAGPLEKAVPVLFSEAACALYDKEKFLALGAHDLMYRPLYFEDMDLSFRAWKRGWRSVYEPKSLHYHHSQTTIGKQYKRGRILRFHWKNRFLFTWKNITSPSLLARHLFFLPFELLLLPFAGRPEFTLGFFSALKQLPEALAGRGAGPGERYTDTDIIRRFTSTDGSFRDTFSA